MGARAWPLGGLCPGPEGEGCGTRFAQTVLAPKQESGPGAATPAGALRWRHGNGALQLPETKGEGGIRCGHYD